MAMTRLSKVRKAIGDRIEIGDEDSAPKGRIPIGSSGWYKTPDVIDPQDCTNYPDSPLCGGNPFSRAPVDLDVNVNIHQCGFDIDVQGTLGFVKLPVHGISYRLPGECRNQPPPPPPPTQSGDIPPPGNGKAKGFDRNIGNNTLVFAGVGLMAVNHRKTVHGCPPYTSVVVPEGYHTFGFKLSCPKPGEKIMLWGSSQQYPLYGNVDIIVRHSVRDLETKTKQIQCDHPYIKTGSLYTDTTWVNNPEIFDSKYSLADDFYVNRYEISLRPMYSERYIKGTA
jgi:hypothetical protein